MPPKKKKK